VDARVANDKTSGSQERLEKSGSCPDFYFRVTVFEKLIERDG
jgi:hypothetical protein